MSAYFMIIRNAYMTPSPTRTTWIMGNWKLNPKSISAASKLATTLVSNLAASRTKTASCHQKMVIAPSLLHLSSVSQALQNLTAKSEIALMAQDICAFEATTGAYTGDVSAQQLCDVGVKFALIGHSERREYHQESQDTLTKKMSLAIDAELTAVFCVGEKQSEREAGQHFDIVTQQLLSVLDSVKPDAKQLIIAYEPVWAIGTGLTASTEDAQAMHAHIRNTLAALSADYAHISILYGGSVKAANAAGLASCDDIDGVLVGGASLDAAQFLDIYRAFG